MSVFRSDYFEVALTKDWLEKKDRKMELKDCSADALDVAVNFMYGIEVPKEFTDLRDLLHLAEQFMMENLTEVVVQRLDKELTKENYLEVSKIAEMYNKDSLINKCALFVYDHMADLNVEWGEMGKLSNVMAAFGKIAMIKKSKEAKKNSEKAKKKSKSTCSQPGLMKKQRVK